MTEQRYRRRPLRVERRAQFDLGECLSFEGLPANADTDRRVIGPYVLGRVRSSSQMSFRRTLPHIREDGTDVTVLWFVSRGRLRLTHQGGVSVAVAGDFLVSRSKTPFRIECLTDGDSPHEALHVVLATHTLFRFLPIELRQGYCCPASRAGLLIAQRMLVDLLDVGQGLPEQMTQMLADSALTVLGDELSRAEGVALARPTVPDRRLQDILLFIDAHLSDDSLRLKRVANACGISSRYLSKLLQQEGMGFSSLVWTKRLQAARQRLAEPSQARVLVSDVAYRSGFRSTSHFSRSFKRRFLMTPVDFRARVVVAVASEQSGTMPQCGDPISMPAPA